MTKPQKQVLADPIGDPADPRLAVGETWHVQLPSATQLATVEIDEMTDARLRILLGRVRPQSAPSAAGELSAAPSPVAAEGAVPATGGADADADADHRRDFAIAQGMV